MNPSSDEASCRVNARRSGASAYDLVAKHASLRGTAIARGIADAKAAKKTATNAPAADAKKPTPEPETPNTDAKKTEP